MYKHTQEEMEHVLREAEEVIEKESLTEKDMLCLIGPLYQALYGLNFWLVNGMTSEKTLSIQKCSGLGEDMQAAADLIVQMQKEPFFQQLRHVKWF
jgi:hypothetical protein